MPKEEKKIAVGEIESKLTGSYLSVLTDFTGINVKDISDLRRILRSEKSEYKVLKNTLIKRVADKMGITGLDKFIEGPTAIAFGKQNNTDTQWTKQLSEFEKKNEKFKIKCGILDSKVISREDVVYISGLSRKVLIGKVVGGLKSPMYGLVFVLGGVIRNFLYALKSIEEKKGQEGDKK